MNNLKQIGIATTNFYSSFKAFPPARIQPSADPVPQYDIGSSEPSWLVRIMPFVEEGNLYQRWDVAKPYEQHPEETRNLAVDLFCCPDRRSASEAVAPSGKITEEITLPCGCGAVSTITVIGGATGDYAGNHGDPSPGATGGPDDYWRGGNGTGVIISSRAKRIADPGIPGGFKPGSWIDKIKMRDVRDGASSTFLAGELHVQPERINEMPYNGPIFNGEDLAAFARIGGPGVPLANGPNFEPSSVLGFGSWHPTVCNFALADGSIRSVSVMIDSRTLGQLCNRNDGEIPDLPE